MATLPADRTKLALAQANQVPSAVASAQRNIDTLTEAYDTIDLLNQKVDNHANAATLPHADGSVTTAKLANGAVTTPKVADGAITAPKVANQTLTADKFVPGALTNDTQNALRITALEGEVDEHLAETTAKFEEIDGEIEDLQTDVAANQASIVLKADKSYVDTQIASVGSGSPKGVYATLSDLQAAHPTGDSNIYLVTADGNWYYWNGSAWTAGGVYQSTGLANDSVDLRHTTFISPGKNKINENEIINGEVVIAPGTIIPLETEKRTDFIYLDAGTYIYSNAQAIYSGMRFAIYDMNKVYQSIQLADPLLTLASAGFVIVCDSKSYTDMQLELGETATAYEEYYRDIEYFKRGPDVRHSAGDATMLEITESDVSYDDIEFYGSNNAAYTNEIGVEIAPGKNRIRLTNMRFSDFLGNCGFYVAAADTNSDTAMISDSFFVNNKVGFFSDTRGEYCSLSNCHFGGNEIAALIRGGNVHIVGGECNRNVDGFVIEGAVSSNDSHGIISSVQINHCTGYGLKIDGIHFGFTISDIHMYQSKLLIQNVVDKPVRISNSYIDATTFEILNCELVCFYNCYIDDNYMGAGSPVITDSVIRGAGNICANPAWESMFNTGF